MEKTLSKVFKRDETVLVLIIAVIFIVFSFLNQDFATATNMFSLARASIISIIFAMGVLLVMISGGIDISFMAVASFSSYLTIKICIDLQWDAPLVLVFLIAAVFGILLGLANAFFVTKIHLPIFIVTLGTQGVIKGALLSFVGQDYLSTGIPEDVVALSKSSLATAISPAGAEVSLPTSILFPIVICVAIALILKYTRLGRMIFAIGGSGEAARRAGINVVAVTCIIYVMVGVIASIGGVVNVCLMRKALPLDLIGKEMLIIAAVILGGGKMEEGRGTVLGAVLGVVLIQLISNNLTLIGVPTYFQQAVMGAIIILGTLLQFARGSIRLPRRKNNSQKQPGQIVKEREL